MWHSCFGLTSGPYGDSQIMHGNLKYSIGISSYAQLTLTEKNALSGRNSTTMFDERSRKFKDIPIDNPDEALDPKYAKYYKDPDSARWG